MYMSVYNTKIVLLFVFMFFFTGTKYVSAQATIKDGEELFEQFKKAILSGNTNIEQVVFVGDNTVYSERAPGGEVEMGTRKAYNFANQSRRTDFKSPVGTITIYLEDNKAAKIVKGRKTPLRDHEEQQLRNGLYYHYLNVAPHGSNYSPEFTGTEELDGTTFYKLKFSINDAPVVYLLHPDSYYPYYVRFKQYSESAGQQVEVTEHYYDWREKNGIAVAFQKETYEEGEIAGEFTYTSVSFN